MSFATEQTIQYLGCRSQWCLSLIQFAVGLVKMLNPEKYTEVLDLQVLNEWEFQVKETRFKSWSIDNLTI
jgi:hypothetical protein